MKKLFLSLIIFSFGQLICIRAFSMASATTAFSEGSDFFQQDCHVIGEDDYVKWALQIEKEKLTLKLTAFEDENCEIPYLRFSQYFKIENQYQGEIDLRTEKVTYTALTDETAVTGEVCDDYQQLAAGQLFYQLLAQDENEVLWGDLTTAQDGRHPTTRPKTFDDWIFKPIVHQTTH